MSCGETTGRLFMNTERRSDLSEMKVLERGRNRLYGAATTFKHEAAHKRQDVLSWTWSSWECLVAAVPKNALEPLQHSFSKNLNRPVSRGNLMIQSLRNTHYEEELYGDPNGSNNFSRRWLSVCRCLYIWRVRAGLCVTYILHIFKVRTGCVLQKWYRRLPNF